MARIYKYLFLALLLIGIIKDAEARIWYVHPDSSLRTIQAGLDSCRHSDTVLVAKGTYTENIVWPNTQNILLISEKGPDSTIIQGVNGRVIRMREGTTFLTIIDGFTIRSGSSSFGGGIYCYNCAPVIRNNKITGNYASFQGGGIFCERANPLILNNTFSYNSSYNGGGIYCWNSSPLIRNNTFSNNGGVADGGAIYCYSSDATIDSNTIVSNQATRGAGVFCSYSEPRIHYNNIYGNTYYGVYNDIHNYVPVLDARYNWWGDTTGPYHPRLNPNGQGDRVSDSVDFEPWLREPVLSVKQDCKPLSVNRLPLKIYPNPASFVFRVRFNPPSPPFDKGGNKRGDLEIKIYDVLGKLVFSSPSLRGNGVTEAISLKGIKDGVYFVKVGKETEKLIVKRK